MRNREYLYAIRPHNGALVAFTLHFPEEILPVAQATETREPPAVEVDKKGLDLAKTLVENLSGDFVPGDYVDEYSQTLLNIIKAKAEGEEYQVEAREAGEKVINLMEALQRSVEAARGEVPKRGMATAGRRKKAADTEPKRRSG
jgi:DNA end-binding protein Ku